MAQRAPLLPGTNARAPSQYAQAQAHSNAHSRSSTVSSGVLNGGYDTSSTSSPAISNGPTLARAVANGGGHDSEQQDSDDDGDGDADDNNDTGHGDNSNDNEEQQPKSNGTALSRHGFDSSEETLRELESRYFLYYTDVSSLTP